MTSHRRLALSVLLVCFSIAPAYGDEPGLVAHWPLAADGKDKGPNGLHLSGKGVEFKAKGPDGKGTAVVFDGIGNHLTLPAAKALAPGKGDFTIALWVNTEKNLDDDLGDLVTWYDPAKRIGFNLSLRTNTGVTTCTSNVRQLQFGIDAGSEPVWTDEGRPGNATLAFGLAVNDGALYAATASNGEGEVGHIYRYDATGKWTDVGAPDKANAISALAPFQGKLYAASSKYRFGGSALVESPNMNLGGAVYRYEGDSRWVEVGRFPETVAIGGLVVYRGRLYASSLYKPAGFFRYESDGKWTSLPVPETQAPPEGPKRVESLGVFNGYLWASSYDGGRVYRYDGETWKDFGVLGTNTQTYSFATHHGALCVGTWPSGAVFRLARDGSWEDIGRLGEELEVMGMLVHNGKLYGGTLPLADVYRYDPSSEGHRWTKTGRLDTTETKYRRAWTMAQHRGRLFCSALPSGHVHALEAGPCVTHDKELPAGWQHVAAVKSGGVLRLYVNGKPVAESTKFDPAKFDLKGEHELKIGAGAGDYFNGALSDVRLYRRALDEKELARLVP